MPASFLRTRARLASLGFVVPMLVGCAVVPRNKLEETRSANRELRSALAEAKDSIARLKTQNRDLAVRSMEESRRNVALEDANERFERDIMTFQEEREQYAATLDQIKSQVLASSGRSRPTASLGPIDRFVTDHPGSSFDAPSNRLSLPSDIFLAGEAELLPKPQSDLARMIRRLAGSDSKAWSIQVIGQDDAIRRVSTSTEDLARRRAERVRDLLVKSGYPADRVTIAEEGRADADQSLVRVAAGKNPSEAGP